MATCLDDINTTLGDIHDAILAISEPPAWTDWNPIVTQGATISTYTLRYAQHRTDRGMTTVRLNISIGASGTPTSPIIITNWPVNAHQIGVVSEYIGTARLRIGGLQYGCNLFQDSGGDVYFLSLAGGTLIGTNPALTLASGDLMDCLAHYRPQEA